MRFDSSAQLRLISGEINTGRELGGLFQFTKTDVKGIVLGCEGKFFYKVFKFQLINVFVVNLQEFIVRFCRDCRPERSVGEDLRSGANMLVQSTFN